MLRDLDNALERLLYLSGHLELERYGHDTHCKDSHILCNLCNDRCRTGSSTTAHTGRDECHLCAVIEKALNLLAALLGSLAGYDRVVSGSKSLGNLLAQLHLLGYR